MPTTGPKTAHRSSLQTQAWCDLYFLLSSPPLMASEASFPNAQFTSELSQGFIQWLSDQSKDPSLLKHYFEKDFRRLGLYAEALLKHALRHNSAIELVLDHFAVTESDEKSQRTVGEIDFVWRDILRAQLVHWELAVKFYLYVPPACELNMEFADNELDHFVGTQLVDTLYRKVEHLRHHQLPLAQHPEVARILGRQPDRSESLLKGWIFYPLIDPLQESWYALQNPSPGCTAQFNPKHLRGWWLRYADWLARLRHLPGNTDVRWQIVPRLRWLSPVITEQKNSLSILELQQELERYFSLENREFALQQPLLISALLPHAANANVYYESHRGFITHDQWGKKPHHSAN